MCDGVSLRGDHLEHRPWGRRRLRAGAGSEVRGGRLWRTEEEECPEHVSSGTQKWERTTL